MPTPPPPPSEKDDAASGIFTYDGSYVSSAQNTMITADGDTTASFAAKVAAEHERVAAEFELPLGVYGFGGQDESYELGTAGDLTSMNDGSQRTEVSDVASAFSGVYDMDESSFLRGVSADAAFEAQERAEEVARSRSSTPAGSKGEETTKVSELILADYDVPKTPLPESTASTASNEGGGILDGLVRTLQSMGLVWSTTVNAGRPTTPETADKTNSPTGSHDDGASAVVSMLSFDGPEGKMGMEANSTTSASRAPFFKGRAMARNYPKRATTAAVAAGEEKPPLLNPSRLISICSCVVLFAVALAVGGWVAISRRSESSQGPKSVQGAFTDDEILSSLTDSPTGNLETATPVASPTDPQNPADCGLDNLNALFEINDNQYDCIWFSQRSAPYREVMCETRPDIASACKQTCSGKCAPTTAPTVFSTMVPTAEGSATQGQDTAGPTAMRTTAAPSVQTAAPSTAAPTLAPSASPSTAAPTATVTSAPTQRLVLARPTFAPSAAATEEPTATPTAGPVSTTAPTFARVVTSSPTLSPSAFPTRAPVVPPTGGPTREPSPGPTGAPVAAPTRAPVGPTVVCPPDTEGFIPGSTTTCAQFGTFHPDFIAQRCQPGWPVYSFCYETCNNCFNT